MIPIINYNSELDSISKINKKIGYLIKKICVEMSLSHFVPTDQTNFVWYPEHHLPTTPFKDERNTKDRGLLGPVFMSPLKSGV